MACSTPCTGATGRRCECSCGGANHARGPMTERLAKHGQMALPLGCRQKTQKPENCKDMPGPTKLAGDYYWDKA